MCRGDVDLGFQKGTVSHIWCSGLKVFFVLKLTVNVNPLSPMTIELGLREANVILSGERLLKYVF
jgi:hypothetical protein